MRSTVRRLSSPGSSPQPLTVTGNQLASVNTITVSAMGRVPESSFRVTSRAWFSQGCRQSHWRNRSSGFRKNLKRGILLPGLACGSLFAATVLLQERDSDTDPRSPQAQPSNEVHQPKAKKVFGHMTLDRAIDESRDLVQRVKDEVGAPGLVIAVSVDGQLVWSEGLGYANVENRVVCKPETVMRIASISKPITMTIIAKLMEAGKLDLDKPVQYYVPTWPEKTFEGKKVDITTRHLVSNMGGIRHYEKDPAKYKKKENTEKQESKKTDDKENEKKKKEKETEAPKKKKTEFEHREYYSKHKYKSVKDSLEMFKNDVLISKPGTRFIYSTLGWTLISAVAEGASGKNFTDLLKGLFKDLSLTCTYLDEHEPLIYNRANFYTKNKRGRLQNAAWVDNSYKWAGGGLLSSATDLVKFGNIMLYSYQWQPGSNIDVTLDSSPGPSSKTSAIQETNVSHKHTLGHKGQPPGYLRPETIKQVWSAVPGARANWNKDGQYAMGWVVCAHEHKHGCCDEQRHVIDHSGGAIGASSQLIILPRKPEAAPAGSPLPQGVVVAIMTNLQGVGMYAATVEIAKKFEQVDL